MGNGWATFPLCRSKTMECAPDESRKSDFLLSPGTFLNSFTHRVRRNASPSTSNPCGHRRFPSVNHRDSTVAQWCGRPSQRRCVAAVLDVDLAERRVYTMTRPRGVGMRRERRSLTS